MIIFNKGFTKGFTLVEVLLALAIFSLVMTPLMIMQGNLVLTSTRRSHNLERILAASSFLSYNQTLLAYSQDSIATKKINFPPATLSFTSKDGAASLSKFKKVKLDQVTIEWTENNRKRTDKIITLRFDQEKK